MMRMNPATGAMEDDGQPEYPSGAVAQQEQDALMAPTFSDTPAPYGSAPGEAGAEPAPYGSFPGEAPSEAPLPATGDALASLGPDQIGPPEMPSVTESPVSDLGVGADQEMAPLITGPDALANLERPGGEIGGPAGLPESLRLSEPTPGGPPSVPSMMGGALVPPLAAPGGADVTQPGDVSAPAPYGAAPGEGPPATPLSPADQLTQDRIAAQQREGDLKAKAAEADARRADAELKIKEESERERAKVIDRGEQRLANALARDQADYDKFREMTVKDAWGDHGTALRVLAGIAMILGGRAGAVVVLAANSVLENKKRTELALQEKLMERNGESIKDIREQSAAEMGNFKMRQAAALDVTAARAEQEKRAQGVPEAQIANDQEILKIKAAAEKEKLEARKLATKEAEQKLKDDLAQHHQETLDKAAEAQARLADARTAKLGKGKSTGGGGGGSSLATRAQAVADAITNGTEENGIRRELTLGEKMAVAKANNIPFNGKSSETTLDSINKGAAFDANNVRKALGKGGTGDTKAIDDSFKPFRIEATGTPRSPGPVRELSKIEEMRKTLDEAAKSGDSDRIKTAMVKAKEQAGTLMSGGKMTLGQIKIMHDLESKVDELVSTYGKWSGNPQEGAGAVRRLTNLIETAGEETVNQVKAIRERAMEEHLAPEIGRANTPEKKRAFESANAGVFGAAEWRGQRLFQEGQAAAAHQGSPTVPHGKEKSGPPSTGRDPATEALIAEMRAAAAPGSGVDNKRRAVAQKWLKDSGIPLQ